MKFIDFWTPGTPYSVLWIYRNFVPTKSTVNFLKPGTAVRSNFIEIYRFFSIFSVFRPAIEPEFWAEKPPCIEGLFSGIRQRTPKVTKNVKNRQKSKKTEIFNKINKLPMTALKLCFMVNCYNIYLIYIFKNGMR
jgi:hypothetical protein